MPRSLPPLQSLRVFEAAARYLSFKLAAEELHVTPAAVSQQIKTLETHLGMPLFLRRPRALELTDAGRRMWPMVCAGFAHLSAAVEEVRSDGEAHRLRVTVPPAFAARWLVQRLHGFTAANPDLDLMLSTRASTIDSAGPEAVERDLMPLRDDDVDVEVRFGRGAYRGMRCDLVAEAVYVPVCHPDRLRGEHPLRAPEDLRYHTLIHDDTVLDRSERVGWGEWLRAAGVREVDATRGPHFSNSNLALEAAMDGIGVALALKPLIGREIATGRLAIPFDVAIQSRNAYYIVTPTETAQRPAVVRFREWLLGAI